MAGVGTGLGGTPRRAAQRNGVRATRGRQNGGSQWSSRPVFGDRDQRGYFLVGGIVRAVAAVRWAVALVDRSLGSGLALVVAGYGLAFGPQLAGHAIEAARVLADHAEHARLGCRESSLQGIVPAPHPLPQYLPSRLALAYGARSFGGALLVAAAGLWWQRLAATSHRVHTALLRPVNAAGGGV